jgi:hypothetical protein
MALKAQPEKTMTDYLAIARAAMERKRLQNVESGNPAVEPLETVLRGRAVELWCDPAGGRLWIVADEEDARRLGERRGEVLTAAELRCVLRIEDRELAAEVLRWKRRFDGRLGE